MKTHDIDRRELLGTMALSPFMVLVRNSAARAGEGQSATNEAITLNAKPEPLAIEPRRAAVIVVDMQNDFGAKGGMFDRAGIDISGIQAAVAPTARVLGAARGASVHVVYLKMGYRQDLSDLGAPGSVNRDRHERLGVGTRIQAPDGRDSRILIRDTWNTDILPDLTPQSGDEVLYKTRFSGFYGTDLDARLKARNVRDLIITGCTTSVCVESTLRDAMFRDYRCVLLTDCMSEPIGNGSGRSNHEASLLVTEVLLGWTSTSDVFVKALSS